MPRHARRLALAVIACFAVVFIAVAVVLSFFRPELEQKISAAVGLDVSLGGPIHAGMVGWRPAIVLYDAALAEPQAPGGTPPLVTAARLKIARAFGNTYAVGVKGLHIGGRDYGDHTGELDLSAGTATLAGNIDGARLTADIRYVAEELTALIKVDGLDYRYLAEGITGGDVHITLDLKARGADAGALLGSLSGRAFLRGGPGRMTGDAVNLWGGGLLSYVLSGPQKETDIRCSVAGFNLQRGAARSRQVVIETERVVITGDGEVNLKEERMNMLFTPQPRDRTLLSLAVPVVVSGPFGNISARPETWGAARKLGGVVLGAINPAAALLPFMKKGAGASDACATAIREMSAP